MLKLQIKSSPELPGLKLPNNEIEKMLLKCYNIYNYLEKCLHQKVFITWNAWKQNPLNDSNKIRGSKTRDSVLDVGLLL